MSKFCVLLAVFNFHLGMAFVLLPPIEMWIIYFNYSNGPFHTLSLLTSSKLLHLRQTLSANAFRKHAKVYRCTVQKSHIPQLIFERVAKCASYRVDYGEI